jgi:transposase-like protein
VLVVVPAALLTAGVDYPSTFSEFQASFADDDACRRYLEKLRWPDGFVCPACASVRAWRIKTGAQMCAECVLKTSVTAGTIFDRTRTPLSMWFAAVWFVCSQKNGVSALGLQRVLGLGSYETAWAWMHKLRRAMVDPDRVRLGGLVEVDETYIGGASAGRDGRGTDKTLVVIAVELVEPKGMGRIRLGRVPDASGNALRGFVANVVAEGSTVRTDGLAAYRRLGDQGFVHEPVNVKDTGELAHVVLPGVHRVASLLKRWMTGTLHYSISDKHLDYYLDEFTFRFNRRNAHSRGLLFRRLLEQAVITEPWPLIDLTTEPLDTYIWH